MVRLNLSFFPIQCSNGQEHVQLTARGQRNVVRNKMWWVQSPATTAFSFSCQLSSVGLKSFSESEQKFDSCFKDVMGHGQYTYDCRNKRSLRNSNCARRSVLFCELPLKCMHSM